MLIKDSIIMSDCWKAYYGLKDIYKEHYTVNHSKNYKDHISCAHTNNIEGNWCNVKQQAPITCRFKERVEIYLIKYMLKGILKVSY